VATEPGMAMYRCGGAPLLVYQSQYAGTNQATSVTFGIGSGLEDIVQALKARGVQFLHYDDLPGTVREGDIHVGHGRRVAWCKDPDGNILNFAQG
jgi:hypothetical protein